MSRQGQQRLGNYEILRQLGRGGFAIVYLGRHLHLGTLAAIKVLNGDYQTEEDIQNFRQEARTIAELKHQHIIRVLDFDVEEEEGTAFLVLEFAPYGNVRSQYGANIVQLEAVISYVQQVASALQYAHKNGIVHRDVKPENMLIDQEKRILLSDFGIALLMSSTFQRTNSNAIGGTPAYIAPEQLLGKPRPASDQYALAVTVYEWLTGSWPFSGTPLEIASQHINRNPPPLRTFVPTIDPAIEAVVLRAMSKKPEQRYPSVIQFARALSEAAQVEPRPASAEHFRPLIPDDDKKPRTAKSTRQFTSVETLRAVRKETGTGERLNQVGGLILSRRAVFVGVGAIAAGIIGLTVANAQRGASSGQAPLQARSTRTAIAPTATPTPRPTATPTPKPTATPTPKPTPKPQPPATVEQPPTSPQQPAIPIGTRFLTHQQNGTIYTVAWSPDGTRIASGGTDKQVVIWSAVDDRVFGSYSHGGNINSVAWSPDGTKLASASDDGTVRIVDASGKTLLFYTSTIGSPHGVGWSPDGTQIASGGDSKVQVWNAKTKAIVAEFDKHTATIWGVMWSPDGTRVASASGRSAATQKDNTVQVWPVGLQQSALVYGGHSAPVFYVAWSPSGQLIASGSADTTVQVWNSTTGATQQIYRDHTSAVYGLAWSPNGARLAAASTDGTVAVWRLGSNGSYSYPGHAGPVYGLAWSPDGTRIATGSADKTVQIWQA